jgi:glycine cleavage system H protein
MSDLVFMMGEFEARFPTDRHYARNHMWAMKLDSPSRVRFGFTAYAVRLLQDVYFLEWEIEDQSLVKQRQTLGAIESKKAESDLFSPLTGKISQFNNELLNDPSAINVDKYGDGWLFEMAADSLEPLLSPEQYLEHLNDVWEVTQRTIKGQLNQ